MASQKIFMSPGVFTSEKDLTFVSQQVGVTTLGLAGETVKGPAFEPIFITNYDEYLTIFGGLNPEKFSNNKPKYELSYIAKSYLTQSNQLFVSRVLGLTGYKAGDAWAILSRANYDPTTIVTGATTTFTADFSGGTTYYNISDGNAQYLFDQGFFPNGPTLTTADIPGVTTVYPEGIIFDRTIGSAFSGVSATISLVSVNGLTGTTSGTVTTYSATTYTQYDKRVLAVLRSRGTYSSDQFTFATDQSINGVTPITPSKVGTM